MIQPRQESRSVAIRKARILGAAIWASSCALLCLTFGWFVYRILVNPPVIGAEPPNIPMVHADYLGAAIGLVSLTLISGLIGWVLAYRLLPPTGMGRAVALGMMGGVVMDLLYCLIAVGTCKVAHQMDWTWFHVVDLAIDGTCIGIVIAIPWGVLAAVATQTFIARHFLLHNIAECSKGSSQ